MKHNELPYTMPFEQIGAADLPFVGGKGANLGEMTAAGFNIPPGFCVTTAAFERFVDFYGGMEELYALLDALPANDVEETRQVGETVRGRLRAVPVPADVAEAITAAWRVMGTEYAYAVRSSATAEDLPDASFAGQQDTYLNVRGVEALLENVRNCWISLFTDRAILYRQRNQFDHKAVLLSVVVQQMVQPEVSGIMFTADPVHGHRGIASIDASFGLGEALVSGLVSADLYQVEKATGIIVKKQIAEKKLAIRSLPEGGTEQVVLTGAESHQPALTEAQVRELTAVGSRIETHYGQPQDIEWALADGEIYVVQSRPITSLYPLPTPAPEDDALHIYISFSHAQVMTDPMSPMGRDMWRLMFPFGRPADQVRNQYMTSAGGRLYIDVSPLIRHPLTRRVIPNALTVAEPLIAKAVGSVAQRPEFQQAGEAASTIGLLSWFLPLGSRILTQLVWSDYKSAVARVTAQSEAAMTYYNQQMASVPAGVARLKKAQQLLSTAFVDAVWQWPRYIAGGMAAMKVVEKLMRGRVSEDDLTALGRGLYGNVTTEMDMAVGDMADAARPYPALVRHLSQPNVPVQKRIAQAADVPGGAEFLDAWHHFLDLYGMRGPSEIDMARPRWREEPSSLLQMIVGNLQHGESGAHRRHHQQLARAGEAAAQRVIAAAGGGLRGRIVRRLVQVGRHIMPVREHPKFMLIQLLWLVKKAILEAAEMLLADGRLANADEVWYLTLEELIDALEDQRDVTALVAERKADMVRAAALTPPRVMTSEGEVPAVEYDAIDAPEGALIGSPVSAGVVEGIAKVILDPQTEVIQRGEILVAPFTDPGWTPLFINAVGLVMEVGGLMTHGSVVAREYGIPAVVGVVDATKRIKSGQRLRVHGQAGYVEILEDEAVEANSEQLAVSN